MKKFLKKLFLAGALGVGVPALIVVVRLVCAQKAVRDAFAPKPGTEAVFIGSSHTGCTWSEEPAYRNRLVWRSASPFVFSYMRLRELERAGALAGVKVCVMDCDAPAMESLTVKSLERQFLSNLPFAWRYLSLIPVSKVRLLAQACWKPFGSYRISDRPPPDLASWATRRADERRDHIRRHYGTQPPWGSPMLCENWEEKVLDWVGKCQEICARNGVRLVLFASPLTAENPQRTDVRWRGKVDEMIGRFRARGVDYRDFRTACSDDMFRDAHHLTREGARRFTARFYPSILAEPPRTGEAVEK